MTDDILNQAYFSFLFLCSTATAIAAVAIVI